MAAEKYSQSFLREVKGKDGKRRGWKGVLKYRVPNPKYVERPEGEDTRTADQKRREVWKQTAKTFGPEVRTKSQATKALADWKAEEEAKLDRPEQTGATVADYVDAFLDGWRVEGSTMQGYRTSAKIIRAEFGSTPMADLDGKAVNRWVSKLGERYSLSTQGKAYRLLNLVCKHAVMDGDLTVNPCDSVKPPAHPKADPNALTKASRDRLLGILAGGDSPLVVGASLALYMGLRQGECCGLRWKDVDLEAGTLDVREAVGQRSGGCYLKATKNDGSTRRLAVPEPMAAALRARRSLMVRECMEAGVPTDPDSMGELFVLGQIDGRFQNPNLLGKQWHALAVAHNLVGTKGRLCKFHDLRHTFATVAIAEGVDVKSVSSFMGHSNAAMTLNVYASADPNAMRAAADVMGRALAPRKGGEADVLSFPRTGTEG